MSVRSYKLVLADDDRLDGFDIAIVLRTVLRRFDMDVVSIEPIDGRASYAEIQARELSLTPEDEDNLARLLGRPEGSSGRGVRRGWWNMACWNGLSFEQQRRLIEVGNLPIDYEPEGEFCDEGATVCIETQHDKAPGPRFYCTKCAIAFLLGVTS